MEQRFLSLAEMEKRLNRKKTAIYKMQAEGLIPHRTKFGWLESEVNKAILRLAANDHEPKAA
ncbi:hypothetical protein ED236_00270 [Pseudomethylobacillus aquaticus]|uniref:DNA-binding protein n=1 Tax=Pseudomethylobacillus aquaticus TaxID=2676064 RepID=A0A3N0V5H8_9PROT|nr:hypothetical protein [Pseudomethylobacillus aquaticus]ROH87963.1 hypothetical protein ED236_00270 [Pseudomethylobacillus aquaticus]